MAVTDQELIDEALRARQHAYCKYSNFSVGAALVDHDGNIHLGCNVENASYPQGLCAEAGAIAAMIIAGGKTIKTIAVAGGFDSVTACTPCGGCRQLIREFAADNTRIIVIDDDKAWHSYTMTELLPQSFHLD